MTASSSCSRPAPRSTNPVDLIGDATSARYAAALEKVVADPNVDGVLMILTPQAMTDVDNVAELAVRTAGTTKKPIITSFMGSLSVKNAVERLKQESIPNFSYPETAVKAFKKLADYRQRQDVKDEEITTGWFNEEAVQDQIDALMKRGIYQAGEEEAMSILACYNFTFPKRTLARTSREAATAAAATGFPVVMKISSPDILHKTDVGGVLAGEKTTKEAEDAFLSITANARRFMPQAFIKGVMVYEMVKGGKEVMLGVTRDPGPSAP